MAEGTLQGSIRIDTSSVEDTIKQINNLRSTLFKYARAGSVLADFNKTFNGQIKSYRLLSETADEFAAAQKKADTIIAKATNTVENFNHRVRNSNLSVEQQRELLLAANSNLNAYSTAVRRGATSGQELAAIQVQLNNSLAQLNREYKDYSTEAAKVAAAEKARDKAISSVELSVESLTSQIRNSNASDEAKKSVLDRVTAAQERLNKSVKEAGADTRLITKAQNDYKKSVAGVSSELRRLNQEANSKQIKQMGTDFRDLTSSVVLALGPLSGIGSRLIALQSLFDRNAAGLAALLAGITGLSVGLNAAFDNAVKAETRFNRLSSQLDILGGRAQFTASELMMLGDTLADATLGGADEFRDAAGMLLQFGNIGRESFEEVITTAYGMSRVMGGSLKQSIRRVGRAMQDPVKSFERLKEVGVDLTIESQKQISVLANQGRKQEAQALILKELSGYYQAAAKEGAGMSGAVDAVGGAFQSTTEKIFLGTKAYKDLTASTAEFAKSIREFADSEYFKLFQDLANKGLGAFSLALDLVKDNLDKVAAVMVGLFVKYTAIGILNTLKLAGSMSKNLVSAAKDSAKGFMVLTGSIVGYETASKSAEKSTKGISKAFRLIPFVAFAAGIVSTIQAIADLKESADSIDSLGVGELISEELNEVIRSSDRLTKIEKRFALERAANIKASQKSIQDQIKYYSDERVKVASEEEKRISKINERMSLLELTFAALNDMDSPAVREMREEFNGLEKELGNVNPELVKIDQNIANLREKLSSVNSEAEKFKKNIFIDSQIDDASRAALEMRDSLNALGNEYRKGATDLDKYEADLVKIENIISKLSSAEFGGLFTEEDLKIAKEAKFEILELIQKQLGAGKTDNFDALTKSIESQKLKLKVLGAEYTSFGKEFDRASEIIKRDNSFSKIYDDVEKLTEGARSALAISVGSMSESSSDVANALIEMIIKTDEAVASQMRLNTMLSQVESEMDSLEPKAISLADKYGVLIEKARELGDTKAMERFSFAFSQAFSEMAKELDDSKYQFNFINAMASPDQLQQMVDRYKAALDQMGLLTEEKLAEINAKTENLKLFSNIGHSFTQLSTTFSSAMDVMSNAQKENSEGFRNLARAQILASQAMAIAGAWATAFNFASNGGSTSVAFSLAGISTATIMAAMGQQLASINEYATGGYVSGAGTATSDSIPAMLSNGEYVINASAVKKLGLNNLNMMNNGLMPTARADGGSVGIITGSNSTTSQSNVNLEIIDQSSGSKEYETVEEVSPDGVSRIKVMIRDSVRELMREGEFDGSMSRNYGLGRTPIRR